jgi:membrane protease YdiL (CAAX protease family)
MAMFMPEHEPAENGIDVEPFGYSICWRCGLAVVKGAERCPHCDARMPVATASPFAFATKSARSTDLFNLLFCTYTVLLLTGIIHALVLGFTVEHKNGFDQDARNRVFGQILVVEGIDTVVVAWAVVAAWGRFSRELPPLRMRLTAWLVAIPVLAALLLLNVGYHAGLREIVHVPLISDRLTQRFDLVAFLAICVQPALVEEVYCRMFALDCLRGVLGRHAAVWISATMFGFMHVAVLPSVPYLIVLGAVLAYMRLASGTLLLPILLHFVHNLVFLLIEFWLQ